jgi:hypothetical protein
MSIHQSTPTVYQARAHATRAARQAAGRYQRPTKAQVAAYQMLLGGGSDMLDAEQCRQLATHPYLTHFQRAKFAALAETK